MLEPFLIVVAVFAIMVIYGCAVCAFFLTCQKRQYVRAGIIVVITAALAYMGTHICLS